MGIDLTLVHPEFAEKLERLTALCEKENLIIEFSGGYRSIAEQNELYAQGRTAPGQKVTNAKGGYSQHNFGIAADFFKNVKGHAYDDDAFFARVGKLAQSVGLGWGGTWEHPDRPHLYLPDWGSTPTPIRNKYGTYEAFKKTWPGKTEQAKSSAQAEEKPVQGSAYTVGRVYTLQAEMRVRIGPGTNYRAKTYKELTADGRKHDADKDGALNKGTRVTCKEVKNAGNNVWMRTPSGWIAAVYEAKVYIK